MNRGEIWWADLPVPGQSEPGYRRPVLIVQSDGFNRSQIRTVVALAITSNLRLAEAPGNISLARRGTGLPRASVINVSQIITLDKEYLIERAGRASDAIMRQAEESLRVLLGFRSMG
ncbi:MAG: type II toxin-antitoxin system PemK/MazF family toxin [Deltaproteobacteria bacterium]|nr:type II toxin-antitoxin system PemK/MazF family toxin [Deltaproteobacteria bacterium]